MSEIQKCSSLDEIGQKIGQSTIVKTNGRKSALVSRSGVSRYRLIINFRTICPKWQTGFHTPQNYGASYEQVIRKLYAKMRETKT